MHFFARAGTERDKVFRHIASSLKLLEPARTVEMTSVVGHHLQALVRAELRANQFEIVGTNTRTYGDKEWISTEHELDFIAEMGNGEAIGVEVKNTLGYIPQQEFLIKRRMCEHLGIRPVFAVRWMPKSYIYQVYNEGGFGWLFEDQAYPLGQERLCGRLRKRFQFPVQVMTEIPPRAQRNFSAWVEKLRTGPA